jgi:hypothetical protein
MATIDWILRPGAHDRPAPNGGTCVNEAAIIAAGLEYRAIESAEDCPPCFSRCLSEIAIYLNDSRPDDLRQELLLPFVPRLAGTADSVEVESRRAEYVAMKVTGHILAAVCEDFGRPDLAAVCRAAAALQGCDDAAGKVFDAFRGRGFAGRAAQEAQQTAFSAAPNRRAAADVAIYATWVLHAALASRRRAYGSARAAIRRKFLVLATDILDGAIRLGRNAEPDMACVIDRLESAKRWKIAA